MKSIYKLLILFILPLLIFVIFISVDYYGSRSIIDLDPLTKCLTEKGAVMYGTSWCSHCQQQKKDFKESFQFIDYHDCDIETDLCKIKEIEVYPTWEIKEIKYPGRLSLQKLAELTGCQLS